MLRTDTKVPFLFFIKISWFYTSATLFFCTLNMFWWEPHPHAHKYASDGLQGAFALYISISCFYVLQSFCTYIRVFLSCHTSKYCSLNLLKRHSTERLLFLLFVVDYSVASSSNSGFSALFSSAPARTFFLFLLASATYAANEATKSMPSNEYTMGIAIFSTL